MTTQIRAVAYYRVSTDQQGRSGLGLDAQKRAVKAFLAGRGWPPVKEYTEIESGKNSDRPKLKEALSACKLYKATLVIATLDRLARNAHFLLGLRDAGVDFMACDMPDANRLTVGIMACLAEDEAERISRRTKAALASAKARGTRLGGFRGYVPTSADRQRAASVARRAAQDRADILRPEIARLQQAGVSTLEGIAQALNEQGISPPRSDAWNIHNVSRLLARLRS